MVFFPIIATLVFEQLGHPFGRQVIAIASVTCGTQYAKNDSRTLGVFRSELALVFGELIEDGNQLARKSLERLQVGFDLNCEFDRGFISGLFDNLRLADDGRRDARLRKSFKLLLEQSRRILLGIKLRDGLGEQAFAIHFLDGDVCGFELGDDALPLNLRLDLDLVKTLLDFLRSSDLFVAFDEAVAVRQHFVINDFIVLHQRFGIDNCSDDLADGVAVGILECFIGCGPDALSDHFLRLRLWFLFPGIGYGGSCFPKDVQALAMTAEQYDYDFKILKSVMTINDIQKTRLPEKIMRFFNNDVKGKTFALWGLAFKPNTDDIREAPALDIINALLVGGANVQAFDPEAMPNVKRIYGKKVTFCKDEYETLENADALIIATEWGIFRTPDFDKLANLTTKAIFDGRNLYDIATMKGKGFHYESIGREIVEG